ncbi:MAG TPA: ShlB/FhaC/HecB family hemolysin secretion/activation protein [Burkholderiales bacterium]|nr:ShlB/FhaC/HecB family hemolysin secretion/activation protein [Burkholderiales bacterium]
MAVPSSGLRRWIGCAVLAAVPLLAHAQAETERFDIDRFEVVGNTLLPAADIDEVLKPFTGKRREYGDVQRALEALELRYRSAGYSAVSVTVPEQELGKGSVRLNVLESRISRVVVEGNKSFSDANIRASLPALKEGVSPRAADISANVQLANENPAKQADVVLRLGEKEGEVEARVGVADSRPLKPFVTLDNTGNQQTGDYRFGVGVQHANLWDRDHVATLNFITSDRVSQVKIYSASYRVPLYALGDSIDVFAAYSDVDAGVTQTTFGPLAFSGKGDVYGLRYNQLLARHGEYSHRIVYGLDERQYQNACTLGVFGSAGCGPTGASVTVRPASLTYYGNWSTPGRVSDISLGYAHNIPGGKNGSDADFSAARPSDEPGEPGASAHYSLARIGASQSRAFAGDWLLRAALAAQLTRDALVSGEQFSIAGATAVRGFLEREIARDHGYVGNVEVYTPNISRPLHLGEGPLRALVFYDYGWAENHLLAGQTDPLKAIIASAGVGLRWNIERTLSLRFDVAWVLRGAASESRGDTRGHVALYYGF